MNEVSFSRGVFAFLSAGGLVLYRRCWSGWAELVPGRCLVLTSRSAGLRGRFFGLRGVHMPVPDCLLVFSIGPVFFHDFRWDVFDFPELSKILALRFGGS